MGENMIISKQKFVEIMDSLQKANDVHNKVGDIFHKELGEYLNTTPFYAIYEQIVVDLLCDMFNSRYDILYFIYDSNYGRDYSDGDVMDHGNIIDLSNSSKLYDYLISNLNEKG